MTSHRRKFKLTRYLKAIVAFFVPVLLAIRDKLPNISLKEALIIFVSGTITALVVWAVPNSQT